MTIFKSANPIPTSNEPENQARSYRFGFIIEQALGHVTHGKNLQVAVPYDPQIQAEWGMISWNVDGWADHLPFYSNNWTVRAGLRARRALENMQRRGRLDAILFHTQVPAMLARDWLDRVPAIVSLDATPLQYDRLGEFYGHSTGPRWLEKWKWKLSREIFVKARHLVTWSEWARQGLIDEYDIDPDKITVIPPGVNNQLWKRPHPHVEDDRLRVLFVGGNLERKGGLLLLESFRQLRREGFPLELHLVTRDNLPPEEGLVLHNNMQPNSPALIELYHNSDIFCLPTYGDCLPMVLSEAAAGGIPLISTRVAGIPEVVINEQTGLLVEPGDQTGLTAALRRLVSNADLRAQMGAAGVELANTRLDALCNALKLLNLMKQIAGQPNPAASDGENKNGVLHQRKSPIGKAR